MLTTKQSLNHIPPLGLLTSRQTETQTHACAHREEEEVTTTQGQSTVL